MVKYRLNLKFRMIDWHFTYQPNSAEYYGRLLEISYYAAKYEDDNIIIVPDYTKVLLASVTDPIKHDKVAECFLSYSDNEKISYAYITTFEKLWLLQTVTRLEVR